MSQIIEALIQLIKASPCAELFVSLDIEPDGRFSAYVTNKENIHNVKRRNE